jgi:hypothetical protein
MSNERMTGVVIKVARRRKNATIMMLCHIMMEVKPSSHGMKQWNNSHNGPKHDAHDGQHDAHDGQHDAHDGQHDAHDGRQDLHDGQQDLLDDLLDRDPALVGSNGGGGLSLQQYHGVFSKSPGIGSYGVYW